MLAKTKTKSADIDIIFLSLVMCCYMLKKPNWWQNKLFLSN